MTHLFQKGGLIDCAYNKAVGGGGGGEWGGAAAHLEGRSRGA